MEQHPVPQHISSYQFRLVGDMTLRQFGLLASGCVVALIFYASPLAGFIKWPLIIFSAFLGFALAFLPVQERPLDKWILAFIKAIFSPTQFVWKKQPQKPAIFQVTPKRVAIQKTPPSPPDQKRLTEYLGTLPAEPQSPLDQQEENFIKKALNMFQLTKVPEPTPRLEPTPTTVPPQPEVGRPRDETQPPPIKKPTAKRPPPKPRPETAEPVKERPIARPKKKPVILPEEPTRPKKPVTEAKFSPTLPFPEPPSQPNTLVGMVLDKNGKIIEGAIIEIRDSQGIPVRALKTNKLGQFRSVTPLEDGEYEIEIEKEGYQFDILKIKLTGAVVEPLEIRAKGKANEPAQNT